MNVSLKRAALAGTAVLALFAVAACGSDSPKTAGTSTTAGGGSSSASISADSFTADFSAMADLKSVAAKGKGLIGVLLPDTTTSARYESFDRPYLEQAFKAAGLGSSDFKIDNAHGSAATMQTQAEADITQGASVLIMDSLDSGSGAAIAANATS
jgi:D-xylose transport system substrate-binding protein